MQFKINDRVQYTAEARQQCDPAITERECRGTVIDIFNGKLKISFDNGEILWCPPEQMEPEHEC